MSITKLPSGKFQVRWNESGLYKKRSFLSIKHAKDFDAIKRLENERGDVYGRDNRVKINGLIEDFKVLKKRTPASQESNEYNLKRIKSYLDDEKITSVHHLTKDTLRRYETKRRGEVSQRTINLETGVLIATLNFAHKNDKIRFNPLANYAKPSDIAPFQRFMTIEEVNLLYNRLPFKGSSRKIFYTYLTCGFRLNELTTLQYGDVINNTIHLRKKILPNGNEWSPKWGKERFIDLGGDYANDKTLLMHLKKGNRNDFVFPDNNGNQFDRKVLYRRFKRIILDSEIENPNEINIHTFRHTHTTYALARGINIRTVMENVGIADYKTLMRYTHAIKGMEKRNDDSNTFPWAHLNPF